MTLSGEEIVELSRRHMLFDWSAQSRLAPMAVDHAEGVYFYTTDGTRYLDFNSQLMGVNIGHGDKRVIDAITKQGEKLPYITPLRRVRGAGAARPEAGDAVAGRAGEDVLHAGWRGGERERDQDGEGVHRPEQGDGPLPLVPRSHVPHRQSHRRPAPLGERATAGPRDRAGVRPLPRPGSTERDRRRGARPARGADRPRRAVHDRRLHPGDRDRDERRADPAGRIPAGDP